MVVHPSTVLSSQAHHRSTTASLTNEQMLAIVWETMKHLTDRRRFERYQAVALMLQRVHYAEIGGIIRRSVTTVCKYIQTYPGTSPRAFLLVDCQRWISSIPQGGPTV